MSFYVHTLGLFDIMSFDNMSFFQNFSKMSSGNLAFDNFVFDKKIVVCLHLDMLVDALLGGLVAAVPERLVDAPLTRNIDAHLGRI
jgi:hypothetical protein